MLNDAEKKSEQQRLMWATADLSQMCVEKADKIIQENYNTTERLKNLILVVNDGIYKISKIQEPTYECCIPVYTYYRKLIEII